MQQKDFKKIYLLPPITPINQIRIPNQNGANTIHHDQSIIPMNLRTINTIKTI
jgi:hypothetical protein